jgi:hypothetical protein
MLGEREDALEAVRDGELKRMQEKLQNSQDKVMDNIYFLCSICAGARMQENLVKPRDDPLFSSLMDFSFWSLICAASDSCMIRRLRDWRRAQRILNGG